MSGQDTDRIAALNDKARTTLDGCRLIITPGIAALEDVTTIINHVCGYTDFNASNDPYGEHDFGSFEHIGQQVFWKIDLYDPGLVKIALNGSFSSWAGGPHTQCSRIGFIRSEVS